MSGEHNALALCVSYDDDWWLLISFKLCVPAYFWASNLFRNLGTQSLSEIDQISFSKVHFEWKIGRSLHFNHFFVLDQITSLHGPKWSSIQWGTIVHHYFFLRSYKFTVFFWNFKSGVRGQSLHQRSMRTSRLDYWGPLLIKQWKSSVQRSPF